MDKSQISVQATVLKSFLQHSIEKELQGVLGTNGLSLKLPQGVLLIERIENIQYNVSGHEIQIAADVEVEYNKEEGVIIAGQAIIHLVFILEYKIASNLTLETVTKLKEHSWIEKPTIKVAKLTIPSAAALNILINSFDEKLGKRIDEVIAAKLDLQKLVTAQLAKAENPLPNPVDNKNIHLFIRPDELLFSIEEREVDYSLSIYTSFDAKAKWEVLPTQKMFSALPNIKEYDGTITPSTLKVPVKIMFSCLVERLKKQFASVELMGRNLNITELKIWFDQRLYIEANISGDITGTLTANAKLRLDVESQVLYLDNLEYDLATSNFLVKAATFLFKGEINKKIDQFTSVPLKPLLNPLMRGLNEKLKEFNLEGINFEMSLDSINVTELTLVSDCIITQVEINANGQLA